MRTTSRPLWTSSAVGRRHEKGRQEGLAYRRWWRWWRWCRFGLVIGGRRQKAREPQSVDRDREQSVAAGGREADRAIVDKSANRELLQNNPMNAIFGTKRLAR